jgi:hypothetical protein
MSSLVIICLSSHYQIVLLPHYEPVPSPASVGYVQTISNLHELLLDWCHPQSLAYVIVPDLISSCVATNPL